MLNINGFKVDRSNLKRIFAAHIAKDEQSMKNPNELMSRRHIDPLVDTLLKHFGKARSGTGGCFSDKKKTKRTSVVPQSISPVNEHKIVPVNDGANEGWQQPLEKAPTTQVI